MKTDLKYRWLFIFGVLIVGILLITGFAKSKDELMANIQKNIKLGLDLKGGSHLVVQLQVQDAFKSEADINIERLREALTAQQLATVSLDRNDPLSIETADSIQINLKGVPLDKVTAVRQIVSERRAFGGDRG